MENGLNPLEEYIRSTDFPSQAEPIQKASWTEYVERLSEVDRLAVLAAEASRTSIHTALKVMLQGLPDIDESEDALQELYRIYPMFSAAEKLLTLDIANACLAKMRDPNFLKNFFNGHKINKSKLDLARVRGQSGSGYSPDHRGIVYIRDLIHDILYMGVQSRLGVPVTQSLENIDTGMIMPLMKKDLTGVAFLEEVYLPLSRSLYNQALPKLPPGTAELQNFPEGNLTPRRELLDALSYPAAALTVSLYKAGIARFRDPRAIRKVEFRPSPPNLSTPPIK